LSNLASGEAGVNCRNYKKSIYSDTYSVFIGSMTYTAFVLETVDSLNVLNKICDFIFNLAGLTAMQFTATCYTRCWW